MIFLVARFQIGAWCLVQATFHDALSIGIAIALGCFISGGTQFISYGLVLEDLYKK